ncbi:MAG: cytochrome P450, partial [Candidatus Binatia bacterium]
SWTFGRLAQHADVLASVEREIERAEGGEMPFLEATIRESLRLHPVIPEVGRRLVRPVQVGRWHLPGGVVVTPSVYLIHRREDLWPEPEAFRPERFLGRRPSPYEFLPFGGGIRRCLGMAFALYEMRIVLAEILEKHTVRMAPGHRMSTVRRSITLAPAGGMPIVVERRGDRARTALP